MTLRKPLVIVSGQVEQLQSGDTLDVAAAYAGVIALTNDEAGAIVIGTPVYADAADGVKKARANATGTSKVVGLVQDVTVAGGGSANIQYDSVLAATTAQWDTAAGTTGGLTFNTWYYLDPSSAGKITPTAPTTVGQLVCPIGKALSTTELLIEIGTSVLL